MIKTTITVKQTSKRINAFKESLLKIHKQKVEAGFFAETGKHYSGMTFPQLMWKHEYGTEQLPPRPVFRNAANNMAMIIGNKKSTRGRAVNDAFKKWKKNLDRKASPHIFLDELGQFALREIHSVFGNRRYLTVTRNPTPLVKKGDLLEGLRYRTSLKTNLRRIK